MAKIVDTKKLIREFSDKKLYIEALTHPSFAAEQKTGYDNQRLEFLGDAVVQIVVTEFLFDRYKSKDEGELTALRAALVRKETLARFARELDLGSKIKLGKGEQEAAGNTRDSILSDAFEALIGAIYLDSGIENCSIVITELINYIYPDLRLCLKNQNPKGTLQEYSQKELGVKPEYKVTEQLGSEHERVFKVDLFINKKKITSGTGRSIKEAEKNAASKALKKIG